MRAPVIVSCQGRDAGMTTSLAIRLGPSITCGLGGPFSSHVFGQQSDIWWPAR